VKLSDAQKRVLRLIHAYGVSGPFRARIPMPTWAGRWHGTHFHVTQAATDYTARDDSQKGAGS